MDSESEPSSATSRQDEEGDHSQHQDQQVGSKRAMVGPADAWASGRAPVVGGHPTLPAVCGTPYATVSTCAAAAAAAAAARTDGDGLMVGDPFTAVVLMLHARRRERLERKLMGLDGVVSTTDLLAQEPQLAQDLALSPGDLGDVGWTRASARARISPEDLLALFARPRWSWSVLVTRVGRRWRGGITAAADHRGHR